MRTSVILLLGFCFLLTKTDSLVGYYFLDDSADWIYPNVWQKSFYDQTTSGFPFKPIFLDAPYSLRNYDFLVEWNGTIRATQPGQYTLYATVDDYLVISIDGVDIGFNDIPGFTKELPIPFLLDQGNHTIQMTYIQAAAGGDVLIQSNSSDCCLFIGGLYTQVYYLDPFTSRAFITRNETAINFAVANFSFIGAIWRGFVRTPPIFINKQVTFNGTIGMMLEIDGHIIFDSFYYHQPSYGVVLLNETEHNYTVAFQNTYEGDYPSVTLSWGIVNTIPFPTNPTLTVTNDVEVFEDSSLSGLLISENATLHIHANLLLYTGAVNGTLIVNGNLSLYDDLTIVMTKSIDLSTPPIIQVSNYFLTWETSFVNITIQNTLPLVDQPFKIISFNGSSINSSSFEISFPTEYRDNNWNCKGNQYQYAVEFHQTGIFIIKTDGSGCGVGIIVVGAVGGSILGLALLVGICVVYQRSVNLEKKMGNLRKGLSEQRKMEAF